MLIEDDLHGNNGEPIPVVTEILDGLLVRGLTTDRVANGTPTDYHIWNDSKDGVSS